MQVSARSRTWMMWVAGLTGGLMLVPGLGQGTARAAYPTCDWTWSGGSGEWSDSAHWTAPDGTHGTPSRGGSATGDVACITAPGTYTVSSRKRDVNVDQDSSDALILGNPMGIQTVEIIGASGADARLGTRGVFNSTALINPTGRVVLTSAGSAGAATLNYSVINHGVVSSEVGAGGARTLQGSMDNSSDGQLQINTDTNTPSEQWINKGIFAVAAGKTFTDSPGHGSFEQNGGTMALSGDFRLDGGSFNHTGGDITGSPVQICTSETLRPQGPGTASFVIPAGCIYSPYIKSDVGANDTVTLTGAAGGTAFDVPHTNRGTIVMDGVGSDTLNGPLTNEGTIRVQPGGARAFDVALNNTIGTVEINADTTSSVGMPLTNSGTFSVASGKTLTARYFTQSGGTLALAGTLLLSHDYGTGTFTDTGGAVQIAGTGRLSPASPLTVQGGTLSGSGTVTQSVTNTGGTVSPGTGASTGVLSIAGDYKQGSGGALAVKVKGPGAGAGFDQLNLTGAANLDGALNVTTTGGQSGDFRVLSSGSRTGAFPTATFTGQTAVVMPDATGVVLKYDRTPPSVSTVALPVFTLASTVGLRYSGSDTGSGLANFDVRYRKAPYNAGFGALIYPPSWQHTTATTVSLAAIRGATFCLSVRGRDRVGNLSAWSAERCTAAALDDRSLVSSTGWTKPLGSQYYAGTITTIARASATLTRTGVQARRLSLVATRCHGCGTVGVYWNGVLIRQISLNVTSGTYNKQLLTIIVFPGTKSGTLVVKTLNSGRVYIDGLATSRV